MTLDEGRDNSWRPRHNVIPVEVNSSLNRFIIIVLATIKGIKFNETQTKDQYYFSIIWCKMFYFWRHDEIWCLTAPVELVVLKVRKWYENE